MIRTIIIDDEESGIATLELFTAKYCPDIEVVATISDPRDAPETIRKLQPDLLFMDIEMPFLNAFDILEKLNPVKFSVIFVTAFNHYAIKAFRFSAVDYLLKPVDFEELIEAVSRVNIKLSPNESSAINSGIQQLLSNLNEKDVLNQTLTALTTEGEKFLILRDILYIEAAGSYSYIFYKNGKKFITSKYLKEFEELLPSQVFFRIHHSFLVNVNHILGFKSKGRGALVELSDSIKIEVSVRKKAEFAALFAKK